MSVPPDSDRPSATPLHGRVDGVTPRSTVTTPSATFADAAIGAAAIGLAAARAVQEPVARALAPFGRLVMSPPFVPRALTPLALVNQLAAHGDHVRRSTLREADAASREVVPVVADAVVSRIDLTELVLQRVDLRRIVEAVLDQLDLTELVLQRVDLDRVVAAVDLDAAASRLDIERVLNRLDLTELVLQRVDLDRIVASVDLDAAVARVDLVGVADYLIEAVDLPEIIRASTGSVATEAVRGVRMQSIDADAQLQRVVDRILLRRKARRTEAPGEAGGPPDGPS